MKLGNFYCTTVKTVKTIFRGECFLSFCRNLDLTIVATLETPLPKNCTLEDKSSMSYRRPPINADEFEGGWWAHCHTHTHTSSLPSLGVHTALCCLSENVFSFKIAFLMPGVPNFLDLL